MHEFMRDAAGSGVRNTGTADISATTLLAAPAAAESYNDIVGQFACVEPCTLYLEDLDGNPVGPGEVYLGSRDSVPIWIGRLAAGKGLRYRVVHTSTTGRSTMYIGRALVNLGGG